MAKKPFLICVDVVGEPEHKRFLLMNNDGEVWTGEEWTKDRRRGRLFHEAMDAGTSIREAYDKHFEHLPLTTTYTCNVEITIKSHEEIPLKDIKDWLSDATQFSMDYPHCGSGPGEDTVLHATLKYSTLHLTGVERKEVKNETS
jgi:hypothetical protein